MVMCWVPAGLGQVHPVQRPGPGDSSLAFFEEDEHFALGVCNGCQMLAALRELIPGADHWPRFLRNRSEQFEARYSLVEVMTAPHCSCWPAWPVRVCPLPLPTAKAGPPSPAPAISKRWNRMVW
jgi:hypothetical protein